MLALNTTQSDSAAQIIKSAAADIKTSFDIKGKYHSFLPIKKQQTEISEDHQHAHVIISKFERTAQRKAVETSRPKKNQVNGTILEVDQVTVKCEVYSNNQNRIINLSKALFKDQATIGMPFTVFLDETSGYKRLLIKDRVINEDIRQQGNDVMM